MVSDEAATRAIMRGICAPDRAARTLAATRLVEMMGGVEDSELFVARLLRAGVLLPLLRMAQCVKRNGDLSPHASCAEAAVHEADAGLIALSQLALLATEILARAGWEVVPDEDSGRLAFAHEATGVAQLATPSLPPVDGPTGGWARELLLDTISLVEPLEVNPASGEVRWPVRVISHECSISEHDSESAAETWLQQCAAAVSVIDVAMDGGGEEQGATVRQLIRGVWRGVDGPRVAELDLAEEAGVKKNITKSTHTHTHTHTLLLATSAATY
ncbi:hypothetical protein T492DRAFT_290871 [Pavlovales sp. CCMP2436]|nr:hypothetical protein T492DRAFT_290871 [Pavlovales sp. CCMP2436]